MKVIAIGDKSANDELFDFYGKKCNSIFLLNYGFIEKGNKANKYIFKVTFDDKFLLSKEKISLVTRLSEDNILVFAISQDFESSYFEEFMSFIRFCMIKNSTELTALKVRIP